MKTKIFTLISAFSFAISSAECSEKMINDMGQDDHATIEYGYNADGEPVAIINKKVYLCKTPVMERRQGLPKTPPSPMIYQTKRSKLSSFGDVEGSIDGSKALDIEVSAESDFITPVKEQIGEVPSYQRPLSMLSARELNRAVSYSTNSFGEDLEEDICKTPVMERRQWLSKTPNAPMMHRMNKNRVSLRYVPMPPSFSDFKRSMDSEKSSNQVNDEEVKSLHRVLFP